MLYILSFIIGLISFKVFHSLLNDKIIENYIEKLISNATFKEIPELIKGKTGYAKNVDVKIFYEDLLKILNNYYLLLNHQALTLENA